MDQIYAPWRIEWVERDDEGGDGCPFCTLPDRGDDREARIVARSPESFVLLNNYPYNPGHAMVIPRVHESAYEALSDEVLLDHARMKQRTFRALDDAIGPDGYNAGLNLGDGAGGSLPHLHTHVVPRWEGDTNFMPVVGDTKVIVEALEETFDRVRAAFADLEGATVDGDDDAPRFPAVDGA
ncbi:HIT family protein [Candidatus Halobonum tyrrellensis]|uniref:HIT family hydrolase, diadenosine tetraphosphate hydrolase n=1 Tax=Candidatus Halobonum tyrrellensis G22 TaxID=1324957 RepID=V4IXE4_9EURY|nr:HIT domain-containing protein [Candidatus Halobonum tyrrellensis]ESP87817.1 HIT family hydrolase, diadenosine tetraphosphate hydrolase [Candidatus Halobonum tyrrellensis G22]